MVCKCTPYETGELSMGSREPSTAVVVTNRSKYLKMIRKCLTTTTGIQITATAVSAIFLAVATWIATLQIPMVEDKISSVDSAVNELRYCTTRDLVQGLYATDLQTERAVYIVLFQLERMMNSSRTKLGDSLLKEVRDNTSSQITLWNSMFLFEQKQATSAVLLPVDPNTALEQAILKLDGALARAKKDAYTRLEGLFAQVNEHDLEKASSERRMKSWQSRFGLLQMLGLLSLVVAVGIEAYRKLKEDVIDKH